MAAAAILNLLFLSILVKCSISGGSHLHCCKNLIHLRQSAAELLLFVQKYKMAAAAILNYNFVMLDHPGSPFLQLKFLLQISCLSSAYFSSYRDSKISQI